MGLSMIGMFIAAAGYLPPVAGAITQEVIDVLAVLNALRASMTPQTLSDYKSGPLSIGKRNIQPLQLLSHPHGKGPVDVQADIRPEAD
jgi:hypothetical protein